METTSNATSRALTTLGVCVALAACAPEQPDAQATEDAEPPAAMEEAATMEPMLPDTTAEAVWAYLQEVDYQSAWTLWPDKGELYSGGEPHGMLLTTYLNPDALTAVVSGAETMPVDAFIVKENYMPDSTLAAVTAMYNVDGYNPDHSDWFFAKYQPDGTVDAAGRAQGCQDCHVAGTDYVMTPDFGSSGNGGTD